MPPVQTATRQLSLGCGHVLAVLQVVQPTIGVPAQTPLVQMSLLVQRLLSLQLVPLFLFSIWQIPSAVLQTARWH
jgi:hypothetical protein